MKVGSIIELGTDELTRKEWEKLLRTLTFMDANDIEVQAYDVIEGRGIVRVPRGVWSQLPDRLDVRDFRSCPKMPKLLYAKELGAEGYEGQIEAVKAMFANEQGQVIAPPGRGKTEIALAFSAAAKTRTLVVVHTYDLFKQWADRAAVSVPGCSVGKIKGKECQVGHITIAMAQTLRRYIRKGRGFWGQFGCLIVDEAHHAAAETWEWLLNVCPAFYRFGITASEKRSDGRQPLVKFNIGPVIHKLAFESQVPMKVVPVKSGFKSRYNGQQWTWLIKELVKDEGRNGVIAKLVLAEIKRGNSILVLSRQIKHLELIHDLIIGNFDEIADVCKVVTGQLPRQKRDELIQDLRDGSIRCILGTQLFEEGVDIPRLNRIVLAFPGTEITALQKVGRGARKAEGKTEAIVYDIVDDYVRVLAKQFLRRKVWYNSVNIKVTKAKEVGNARQKGKGHSQAAEGRKLRHLVGKLRPRRPATP
jgi:superfamily II DNA or RNA helicase